MPRSDDAEEAIRQEFAKALAAPPEDAKRFNRVLERLFNAYRDDVRAVAERRLAANAGVDEVFAATWDAVPRALETFKGESSFRSWLLQIARNKATDMLRRGHERDREALSNVISTLYMQAPSRERPSRRLARAELERLVRKLIDELSPQDRALLVLHYQEGKKAVDIARERGVAPNTVAQQIVRARARLQKALEAVGIKGS